MLISLACAGKDLIQEIKLLQEAGRLEPCHIVEEALDLVRVVIYRALDLLQIPRTHQPTCFSPKVLKAI